MRKLSEMLLRIECCERCEDTRDKVSCDCLGDDLDKDLVRSSACELFSMAHRFALLYDGLEGVSFMVCGWLTLLRFNGDAL